MNNQAAQTMPIVDDFNGDNAKLIESARALISLNDSGSLAPHGIGGHARAILSSFIVRTEAAALSQTAGVAEPNGKLVGWWNGIMPDVTERSPYGPSVRWGADAEDGAHDIPLYDGYNPIHYRQPDALAAAPAASGGEDGWSLAMRVREALDRASCPDHFMRIAVETITGDAPQPPAAASARERARIDTLALDVARRFTLDTEPQRRASLQVAVIAALEQALTQQRGEPIAYIESYEVDGAVRQGLVWADHPANTHGSTFTALYTTPQPGAEAMRELVQRWRHEARDMVEIHGSDQTFVCVADALEKMADELESLLGRGGK